MRCRWMWVGVCLLCCSFGCTTDLLTRRPEGATQGAVSGGADVVVLMHRQRVDVREESATMHIDSHTHLWLRTAKGCAQFQRVLHSYRSTTKLKALQARVIRPDGSTFRADTSFAFPSTNFSSPQYYDDDHGRMLLLKRVVPGSILDVRFQQEVEISPTGLTMAFQRHGMPVKYARLEVTAPKSFALQHRLLAGFQAPRAKVKFLQETVLSAPERRRFVWSAQNIPALEKEPNMPYWRHALLRVELAFGQYRYGQYRGKGLSWSGIGSFFSQMAIPHTHSTAETALMAASLVRGKTSQADKIRALYNFVRRQIRYLYVGLALGGYVPQKTQKTLKYRYGDCKAKSVLLVSMLRSIGVKAYLVLVRTRNRGPLSPTFFMGQFNHQIVYLPTYQGGMFVDPTTSDNRLESLRWDNQGASGLILDGEKSRFVTLPIPKAKENLFHRTTVLTRGQGGQMRGTIHIRETGYWRVAEDGLLERGGLKSPKQRKQWLQGVLSPFMKERLRGQLTSTTSVGDDGKGGLTISGKLAFSHKQHDLWLSLKPFRSPWLERYLKPRKHHRMVLHHRFVHIEELHLRGWKVIDWPARPLRLSSPFFSFALLCQKQAGGLRCQRRFEVKRLSIPLSALKQIRQWSVQIEAMVHKIIVLSASDKPTSRPRAR